MPSPTLDKPRRALFALVIFAGSFLLFLIQPLVARLALPQLGGAPNVWNSAMLVFQLLLLGGYAYAHWLGRLTLRRQGMIHIALLLLAALVLPISLADIAPPAAGWEVLWVPALLGLTVGPVFLLVAAQASLIQRWFAAAPGAGNPYPLYAASNLGSFAGLLAYPLWLEPRLSLSAQSELWSLGYGALILLSVLALAQRWRTPDAAATPTVQPRSERPPVRTVLLWLALAAVPSGLMLSTTTLLTTDLMAMPLLWVIPLGLYLLSFSVAFSEAGHWTRILTRMAPVLLLAGGSFAMVSGGQANPAIALAMVGLLFVLAVALHGRLYALRPDPSQLTYFYLIVAAGGALGGGFTALLAPVLFDWIYEHAILLLAGAALMPQTLVIERVRQFLRDRTAGKAIAAALVVVAALLAFVLHRAVEAADGETILALIGALVLIGAALVSVRWAFVAVAALLMLGHGGLSTLALTAQGERARTYFGVYSVVETEGGRFRQLNHGTTNHGRQWLDPERRRDPTSYYGHSAGIGIALGAAAADAEIGVVGLGAGTLACYRQPGQRWSFFEIDPQIAAYSRDGSFTFLSDCTPDARMVIGDARLELAKERTGRFDLLAIDAFSSDSIPLHLMTEEAFAAYGRALDRDGLLLVHISNRFIDLAPMVAALAEARGWQGRLRFDEEDLAEGLTPSVWIALARDEAALARLDGDGAYAWEPLPRPALRAWTDNNASILPLIRW
ncbi:MAG: fused MFS/spermidine synthase [Alphaproteobacteria bacterium]|nr:fused MFS/spermidine synthase [Alphaproteobacteria bacterium]